MYVQHAEEYKKYRDCSKRPRQAECNLKPLKEYEWSHLLPISPLRLLAGDIRFHAITAGRQQCITLHFATAASLTCERPAPRPGWISLAVVFRHSMVCSSSDGRSAKQKGGASPSYILPTEICGRQFADAPPLTGLDTSN